MKAEQVAEVKKIIVTLENRIEVLRTISRTAEYYKGLECAKKIRQCENKVRILKEALG